MTDGVRTFIWYLTTTNRLPGPVLEVGSRPGPSQPERGNLRPFFPGVDYTGIDLEFGPGVDSLYDAENLEAFASASFGTVLCLETLEHVRNPQVAVSEMWRMLGAGGYFVISSQMNMPVHWPVDYWRFTPQCFNEVLLSCTDAKQVLYQGDRTFPHTVIGLAQKKPGALEVTVDLAYLNGMLPCPYPFPFMVW